LVRCSSGGHDRRSHADRRSVACRRMPRPAGDSGGLSGGHNMPPAALDLRPSTAVTPEAATEDDPVAARTGYGGKSRCGPPPIRKLGGARNRDKKVAEPARGGRTPAGEEPSPMEGISPQPPSFFVFFAALRLRAGQSARRRPVPAGGRHLDLGMGNTDLRRTSMLVLRSSRDHRKPVTDVIPRPGESRVCGAPRRHTRAVVSG